MKKFVALFVLFLCIGSLFAADRTIVGVHGYMLSSHHMMPVAKALRKCGCDVCLWDYQSRKYSIEEHAEHLVQLLREIACNRPGEPIDFVAHSVGALVLRAALNMPDCPQEALVGRAVLLAPPNQGTCFARSVYQSPTTHFLARLAFGGKSGLQIMTYRAEDIQRCFGHFPPTMSVLVVAGCKGTHLLFNAPNDGYLAVWETELETPHYWEVLDMTHGTLLTCSESLEIVVRFLCRCDCHEACWEE